MRTSPPTAQPDVKKQFSSSILLWVRTDQPRQTGLDYWKGPHSAIIVFRRTLLNAGPPNSSRWYDIASPAETVGSRAIIYLRRRDGVRAGEFRKFVNNQFGRALASTGVMKELRTQTFLPWSENLWDTPHVAHDNPDDRRFHASVILGFADTPARDALFTSSTVEIPPVDAAGLCDPRLRRRRRPYLCQARTRSAPLGRVDTWRKGLRVGLGGYSHK